jgi:undecaprenol kinase
MSGIRQAWRRERSLRTQTFIGAIAAVATIALRPGLLWGGLVALSIALVLGLELANSAIEYLIDHLHPEVAPEIKLAKDVVAGGCWSYEGALDFFGTDQRRYVSTC